jgi:hypothetical protein
MPSQRKPNPKSQKEISNNLINPYTNPDTGETLGNPNQKTNFQQFSPTEQNGIDFNRSEKLSFKNDSTKPFSIGIQDIDEAIFYYFENVIRPFVIQNSIRIAVPVIYGSPEKWKSVQKDGYYKDKNGKIMNPIIMFKRDNIEKNRTTYNKLDANSPNLFVSWQKPYNTKNAYSNFNLLTNKIPAKQFIVNVVPDYVTVTYNFIIQTYYMDQLNKIVEAINYASDSYWGDPERFKFKATIDSFGITTELNQDSERTVRSTFTLKVHGYIVPDTIQKDVTSIKKYNSKAKIIIGLETTDSISETVASSNQKSFLTPSTIFPSDGGTAGGGGVDPFILSYLNTNIQKLGAYINSTTVTFNSGWLIAPTNLPPTSINNFSIFINGQLVEQAAIVSFTELNGITTLIINPTQLGFSIDPNDEVIAIGKFSN